MKPEYYRDLYRGAYARLGYPLKERHGIPLKEIVAAEKRLGLRLPTALREYYLVAGCERVVNRAFNRLRPPGKWEKQLGKLVFLDENQEVVAWGLTASRQGPEDPAVYQGLVDDGEIGSWALEERKCSVFLVFTLHLQLCFGGGKPYNASGPGSRELLARLDRDWHFGGEVNGVRAYSRDGKAVCLSNDPFQKKKASRVCAGARSKEELLALASDLNVEWDDWSWPSFTV